MALDNKPPTIVFYSGIGISIRETRAKLRMAMKWRFAERVRYHAA
jgi:hypothetical protein